MLTSDFDPPKKNLRSRRDGANRTAVYSNLQQQVSKILQIGKDFNRFHQYASSIKLS